MGFYIQGPMTSKAQFIVSEYDGKIIPQPKSFNEIPEDQALICVVSNASFEAAGYCFSEREFESFSYYDGRPKTWLVMDKELAKKITGCKE